MSTSEGIIVLSDVHLAAERARGLFRADAEMAAFLDWVLREAGPSRVIIAGDFLDFLVPGSPDEELLYFDPLGARERAASIVEHHAEVFDALARIAASAEHELWIASGNHDPELLFLDVREVIERRLRSSSAGTLRWSVDGEAIRFRAGDASIMVVHGDVFDDWNRVDRGSLRRAANRISYGFKKEHEWEYKPPVGTRIVIDHLLRLRNDYPWVDVLKPEREAVFPIVHQFLTPGEHVKYRQLIGTLIKGATESWLKEAFRRSAPQKLVRGGRADAIRQQILRWIGWEEGGGASNDRDLIEKLRQVSEGHGYFDISVPDEPVELLPHFFVRGTDLLVAGHTHAAKAVLVGEGCLYLNTGTWARLLQLPGAEAPDEIWSSFLQQLRAGEDLGDSRPSFAWIQTRDRQVNARLMSWSEGSPVCQASFRFSPTGRSWVSENCHG